MTQSARSRSGQVPQEGRAIQNRTGEVRRDHLANRKPHGTGALTDTLVVRLHLEIIIGKTMS